MNLHVELFELLPIDRGSTIMFCGWCNSNDIRSNYMYEVYVDHITTSMYADFLNRIGPNETYWLFRYCNDTDRDVADIVTGEKFRIKYYARFCEDCFKYFVRKYKPSAKNIVKQIIITKNNPYQVKHQKCDLWINGNVATQK